MKVQYDTSYRWVLSIGTGLLIIAIAMPLKSIIIGGSLNNNQAVISIIFTIISMFLIGESIGKMKIVEDAERRYKEELTINEIIKQDKLLVDLDLKFIQYNKISKNKEKRGRRTIKSIVSQALEPNYYNKILEKKNSNLKDKDNFILGELKKWFKIQ